MLCLTRLPLSSPAWRRLLRALLCAALRRFIAGSGRHAHCTVHIKGTHRETPDTSAEETILPWTKVPTYGGGGMGHAARGSMAHVCHNLRQVRVPKAWGMGEEERGQRHRTFDSSSASRGSCTPTLRTIPLAQKPGKMPLSHYALEGARPWSRLCFTTNSPYAFSCGSSSCCTSRGPSRVCPPHPYQLSPSAPAPRRPKRLR